MVCEACKRQHAKNSMQGMACRGRERRMKGELFTRQQLRALHEMANELGLAERRQAMLAPWPKEVSAKLPIATIPGDQLWMDMCGLNSLLPIAGQESLLEIWLETAYHLNKNDPRSHIFQTALFELRARRPRKPSAKDRSLKTTILTDRTTQWATLLDACKKSKEHLLFLVHGTEECAPAAFAKRVAAQVHSESERRKHRVGKSIDRFHDGEEAQSGRDWLERFVYATDNRMGALGPALMNDAQEACPVYVLLDNGGALQASDQACILEVVKFIRQELSDAIGRRPLRNPLRLVIAIEHAPLDRNGNPLMEQLKEKLCAGTAFRFVPLDELHFPPWIEVRDSLMKTKKATEQQLSACWQIYLETPHSFVDLTTRLHEYFVNAQQ